MDMVLAFIGRVWITYRSWHTLTVSGPITVSHVSCKSHADATQVLLEMEIFGAAARDSQMMWLTVIGPLMVSVHQLW